jgi:hypothetical protein
MMFEYEAVVDCRVSHVNNHHDTNVEESVAGGFASCWSFSLCSRLKMFHESSCSDDHKDDISAAAFVDTTALGLAFHGP